MLYRFQPMSQQQAEEIATCWRYEGIYAFYNMDADPEDLQEFLNSNERGDSYFVVTKQHEVIGFYSFSLMADRSIDIGLGMKPCLTGQGNGLEFIRAGLDFVISTYKPEKITLSVAIFNVRAINVYKKAGFQEDVRYIQATNGNNFEFMKMIYQQK